MNNKNNSEYFLINFFYFLIDLCENKNVNFKDWIKLFLFLFILSFFWLLLPSILYFFFQHSGWYIQKYNWGIIKIIVIGFLTSFTISLIIILLCIVFVIIIKLLLLGVFLYKNLPLFFSEYIFFCYINRPKINWQGLFNDLKEYYPSVIFTFSLFSLIIWLRLIRERLPMDLNQTFNFGLQTILVLAATIIFFFFTLINFFLIKKNLVKESKFFLYLVEKEKNFTKNNFYKFFLKHILDGLPNTFNIFFNNINALIIFEFFQKLLVKYFLGREKYFFIFFWFLKFLIVITFFIEIVFYKQIIYFYKIIPFILLPLIFQLILYMTKEQAIRSLEISAKYMTITEIEKNTLVFSNYNEELILADFSVNISELDLISIGENWLFYQNVYRYYIYFENYKEKYDKYLNLIYFFLFFITFLFYLLILINIY